MREFTDGPLPSFEDVAMARVSVSDSRYCYARRGLSTSFGIVGFSILTNLMITIDYFLDIASSTRCLKL